MSRTILYIKEIATEINKALPKYGHSHYASGVIVTIINRSKNNRETMWTEEVVRVGYKDTVTPRFMIDQFNRDDIDYLTEVLSYVELTDSQIVEMTLAF